MYWEQVEKIYGKKLANKMKKSKYLQGITVILKDGKHDIPKEDIERAYKDVTGEKIQDTDWD